MMKRRFRWGVAVAACMGMLFLLGYREERARAVVRETNESYQERSTALSAQPEGSKALSVWHTCLWEALPQEWLQDSTKTSLLEAYQENDWKPFFISEAFELEENGRLLLQRLETMPNDAIDPRPYQVEDLRDRLAKLESLRLSLPTCGRDCVRGLTDVPDSASPSGSGGDGPGSDVGSAGEPSRIPIPGAEAERERARICRELLRMASALDVQLANDLVRFTREMNPFAQELQVKALLRQYPMDQFLRELEPPAHQYQVLLQALRRYRQLAAQGHQQRLVPAQKLSPGDAGSTIRDLQQRLEAEGFYHGKITGHFDEPTRQAVQDFQLFHNLDADGKVGQQTREWLNVSFQAKADLIAQALRLFRQSETRRYQKFVWINIPQFTLEYRNEGKVEAVHRVIVGKASGKKVKLNGRWVGENQTPTLASTIHQVVFNPRWIVTDRIRQELSDAIAADPSFLSRNGYIELNSTRYRSGEPLLIQLPGPNNALGRVRFDFPNPYAVYMHDTPNRGLFQRSRRDFSHGCIRVDKAPQLARELLAGDQNPAASKTQSFLDSNRETFLRLNEPVPIIIEYLPVVVNARGELVFCGDPYNWFQDFADRKS